MYRRRYNIDTHYKLSRIQASPLYCTILYCNVLYCTVLYVLFSGQPTKVEFHVTVMSLDSINEGSMVSIAQ